jgi:pimeloyl-ACP methyl ester carboxylesterase
MKEKAYFFGKHKSLFGIITEPPSPALAAGRPAILLLNAGVIHRIGPHRKSVQIARRLAAEGFVVMRFDQSGLGDSEPRRDALSFQDGAVSDIQEAMEHLEKTKQIGTFVLMGLCSGADNSFQTTIRDKRSVGALMMDGYSYKTPEFFVRDFMTRARKVRSWKDTGKRKISALLGMVQDALDRGGAQKSDPPPAPAGPIPQYVREFPEKEQFISDLLAMVARGVKTHFVYSSGMPEYYNYEGQFMDALGDIDLKGLVTTEFFGGTDHTFTEQRSREELVSAVVGWARRSFPAQA